MRSPKPLSNLTRLLGVLAIFSLLLVATFLMLVLASLLGLPTGAIAAVVLPVSVVASLVALFAKLRRAQALLAQNQQAIVSLNQGDVAAAAKALDELVRISSRHRSIHALARLNRSVVWARQGDPERALSLSLPLLEAGWHERGLKLQAGALVSAVAFPLALLGRTDPAEAVLNTHLARLNSQQVTVTLVARVILLERRERWEEALTLVTGQVAAAEGVFAASSLRTLSALAAFAADRAGKPSPALPWPVANESELRYLTTHWPAFEAWLSRER